MFVCFFSGLAACVNAGSLALADAGIPMRGLAAAAECGSVEGIPCADMSAREHTETVPRLTLATISFLFYFISYIFEKR
jgi:ribonuclease PH